MFARQLPAGDAQDLYLLIGLLLRACPSPGKPIEKALENWHHHWSFSDIPRQPEGPAEGKVPWQLRAIRAWHHFLKIPAHHLVSLLCEEESACTSVTWSEEPLRAILPNVQLPLAWFSMGAHELYSMSGAKLHY